MTFSNALCGGNGVSPVGRAEHQAGGASVCPSPIPVEDTRVLAKPLSYVSPINCVERFAKIGEVRWVYYGRSRDRPERV
jgi:hypothetical protein